MRSNAATRCVRMALFGFVPAVALIVGTALPALAAIEAVKGKTYRLTGKHGPWMIMVTSLSGETPQQEANAEKAANALVYQLRKKGIPAYVYRIEDEKDHVPGVDRMGRATKRTYVAQHGMIGVVAGNYNAFDDKVAQQTKNFIKKMEPKITVEGKDGKPTEVVLSLSKAFLTRNPLLTSEELSRKVRDPLMLKINSGVQHSLLENKGRYSLVVSSFYGNSQIKPASFQKFDTGMKAHSNISLENAALESSQLCRAMREQGHEAYVYHERFRSVVTVGSFKSKDDPEIARLFKMYQAKYKRLDSTGQEVLVAESIQVPGLKKNDPPARAWTMDPVPELIEVPAK